MTNILLTPYDGAILGPIAKILGWIMDVVYVFMYETFGIENVGGDAYFEGEFYQ